MKFEPTQNVRMIDVGKVFSPCLLFETFNFQLANLLLRCFFVFILYMCFVCKVNSVVHESDKWIERNPWPRKFMTY
jgi:hypothetical protein